MIDPYWTVVDLDPYTWRTIGHFFDPGQYIRASQPGEHGLFVLHNNGQVLRIVDTQIGLRDDLPIKQIDDAQTLAQTLFAGGTWDRVHIINKQHLAEVAYQAQAVPQRSLHLDEYYQRVQHLLWGQQDGYVSVPVHPGHWHGWTLSGLRHFVSLLPPKASLALGVFDGATLTIGLILELNQGVIQHVTTFEALTALTEPLEVSEQGLSQIQDALTEQFAQPAGILLCTQGVFDAWIQEEDKVKVLEDARKCNNAFWHLIQ